MEAVAESAAPAHVATVGVAGAARRTTSRFAAAADEGAKRTTGGSSELAVVAGGPSIKEVRQDSLNAITDETTALCLNPHAYLGFFLPACSSSIHVSLVVLINLLLIWSFQLTKFGR